MKAVRAKLTELGEKPIIRRARNLETEPDATAKPAFIITIDTECDNAWERSEAVTTKNAAYLPRFQALAEAYGLRPTWLTNFEMATDPVFVDFGRDVLNRGAGEIGMHLHAWNSPPDYRLSQGDHVTHPYLIEYPEDVMRKKVEYMTGLLEDTFDEKMVSHRAGRWAFNETYAQILVEQGYTVDCSVSPHVSWAQTKGLPDGPGGTNYRRFPEDPYFLDLEAIMEPGTGPLLEVPVTIVARHGWLERLVPESIERRRGAPRAMKRLFAPRWLRPTDRTSGQDLIAVAEEALSQGRQHLEFMVHSSELMPGGSPTFHSERSIEDLYVALDELFDWAETHCDGLTLAQFRRSSAVEALATP